MKATSKPVEVEYIQWTGYNECGVINFIEGLISVTPTERNKGIYFVKRGYVIDMLHESEFHAKYDIEQKESEKQKLTMKHLDLYRAAINEIDDFFEYANESDSDKKKVREILNKLTVGLMFSVGGIKPPVTESKE